MMDLRYIILTTAVISTVLAVMGSLRSNQHIAGASRVVQYAID